MAEREGAWVSLFSGGKDSAWALAEALDRGLDVQRLLTMVPPADSWLFHVPGAGRTDVLAASIGLPLRQVEMPTPEGEQTRDASAAGDREAAELERALLAVSDELDDGLAGIVSGAVASEFQHDRLERLASTLEIEHFDPLWGVTPERAARQLVQADFDIRIVAVAAAGLDRSWLGRRYDDTALQELLELADRYGVHPLGEGGEFETIALDGPHMNQPVSLETRAVWEGDRGYLEVLDAWREPADGSPTVAITARS